MNPGATQFTLMPFNASSFARAFEKRYHAAFSSGVDAFATSANLSPHRRYSNYIATLLGQHNFACFSAKSNTANQIGIDYVGYIFVGVVDQHSVCADPCSLPRVRRQWSILSLRTLPLFLLGRANLRRICTLRQYRRHL